VLEDAADRIGVKHGAEARERFTQIATGASPLEHHLEAHLRESGISPRAVTERRTAVNRVAQWRPRLTLRSLTRRQAGEYVSEVLAAGHPKTGNKVISNLSRYWDWLVKRGHAAENPWQGQRLDRRTVKAREPERTFTDDEMKTLLKGPFPAGMRHRERLEDAMRVAALSGMRIDEICRLTVADCGDGVFNIRKAKTAAGVRKVPIHSALKEIIERRAKGKEPAAFLFDDVEKVGKGERSMPLSKQFTRYRRELKVDAVAEGQRRSLVNFHSFRRWFVTQAERAGQPPHILEAVVGHKRAGMSLGVYSGGPSVEEQMRACVEAVRLPSVTSL
jgi:integrase